MVRLWTKPWDLSYGCISHTFQTYILKTIGVCFIIHGRYMLQEHSWNTSYVYREVLATTAEQTELRGEKIRKKGVPYYLSLHKTIDQRRAKALDITEPWTLVVIRAFRLCEAWSSATYAAGTLRSQFQHPSSIRLLPCQLLLHCLCSLSWISHSLLSAHITLHLGQMDKTVVYYSLFNYSVIQLIFNECIECATLRLRI